MRNKQHPLICCRSMRDAIRREVDPKTQTRRVIVPQPVWFAHEWAGGHFEWGKYRLDDRFDLIPYAPWQVGDELWLREPVQIRYIYPKSDRQAHGTYLDNGEYLIVCLTKQEYEKFRNRKHPYRPTSSLFMYKSLARKFVKIKRVWIEQTQDISEADVIKEGLVRDEIHNGKGYRNWRGVRSPIDNCLYPPKIAYKTLWDSINEKRGYGWDVNTFNFCYEWEVM